MPDNIKEGEGNASTGTQSQSASSGQTSGGTQTSQSQTQTSTGESGQDAKTGTGGQTAASGNTQQQTGTQQQQTQTEVKPDWPTDWRQKLAGAEDKDGKVMKRLERFASPLDLLKSFNELETKLSSGEFKRPLSKDATPEQIATYRKENGIPETPDKYDLNLPDGLVIGEQDKQILSPILADMHNLNLTADQVKAVVSSYKKQEAAFLIHRTNEIAAAKQANDDILHKEWGEQYRTEVNRVENLLATYSPETQEALQNGTDVNGLPFLNNVHVMRDLAVQARIINPAPTVVGAGGTSQMASVETEITKIESLMGDKQSAYWKGDQAAKMQARYLDLVDWKDRQKTRAGAA